MARAHVQVSRLRAEVDHHAACREALAVLGTQHRATPGSEDDAGTGGKLVEDGGLAGPEPFLALDLEDQRHLHPAAGLEFEVRVDEWPVQAPREQPRNRGLARAHHADKENVFAVFHDVIVSEKTKAGVNPA